MRSQAVETSGAYGGAQNWASHNGADEDSYGALDRINQANVKTSPRAASP